MLFGAAVGGVLSLWRLRTRGILTGAAAGVLAIVAFALLATAGLSILTRYLLFPATLLAIFAAAGICAWVELPREDPWRNRWMALGALTVVGLLVFIPSQLTRLRNTRHALIAQTHILDELHDLAVDHLPADAAARLGAQPPRGAAARAVDRPPPVADPQRAGGRPLLRRRRSPALAGGREPVHPRPERQGQGAAARAARPRVRRYWAVGPTSDDRCVWRSGSTGP